MKIFLIVLLILALIACFGMGYVIFANVLDTKFKMPGSDKPADPNDIDGPNDLMRPTAKELYAFREPNIKAMKKLLLEELTVTSFDGLTLRGYLLKGDPKEVVICVHGYKSSKEEDFAIFVPMYQRRGCTCLFVDNRAHQHSEGRYIGFSELDRFDVAKWVDKINELYDDPRIYLHGASMGGATVVHCADMDLKNVRGIFADCPFNSIRGITKALMKDSYHIPYMPFGYIAGWWSKLLAHIDFDKSVGEKCVANAKVPMVFVHGTEDHFVPCSMTESMAAACTAPKKVLYVKGAGHVASYMKEPEAYEELFNELLDGKI